jgi:hypothetical protein
MAASAPSRRASFASQELEGELDAMSNLPLPQLRAYWNNRWGALPAFRARDQLCRAAAYRLQAEAQGGLPTDLKRDLGALAVRFNEDRSFNPGPAINLKPGSSLVREWGGKRHEVAVTPDGFVYDGALYGSLSKVAGVITGTKWNGPVFFGVKPRKPPMTTPAKAAR